MYINIVDDVEIIINSKSTRHRKRMVEVLCYLLKEIIAKPIDEEADEQLDKETDEQPDTTDMPGLESDESAARKKSKKRED